MEFKCIRKCFYEGTLYIEGRIIDRDLKEAPAHFEKYTAEKIVPKDDEQAKTLNELQEKNEVAEKLCLILKLNKDDLIVEAAALGLSEGNDLAALTKVEIIDLVKKKLEGKDETLPENSDIFE